ncbi:MAG: hypothetical protein Crog4KO_22450 [Crocinitomicaceae bacterium]
MLRSLTKHKKNSYIQVMKNLFILTAVATLLLSCQSELKDESKDTSTTPDQEVTEFEQTNEYVYKSDDTGATEYMRLIIENGERQWFYSSDKNEEEVRLGVKEIDGLEAVYFFGKKNEIYEMAPSECGFSLFLGENRLQWYQQTTPECTRSY